MLKKSLLAVAMTGVAAFAAASAHAADKYPSRPITLVVPYTPAGSSDTIARTVAEALRKELGQPIVIDNKPGAGTAIGSDYVARAEPDGYTLLFAGSSLTIVPAITKASYDPVKDFAPVSQVLSQAQFLVVRDDLPVKNTAELIAYAKKNPNKLNYGSAGNGSITHFQMALFAEMAGIDLVHVPYKGMAPAVTGLLGGQVQLMFDGLSSIGPHIKSGAARPLAVALPKRSKVLPDVPTVVETGLPEYEATPWAGVLAPAGTPKPIIDRLNEAVRKALQDKDVQERITGLGGELSASTPEEISGRIQREAERWKRLAAEMNLQ